MSLYVVVPLAAAAAVVYSNSQASKKTTVDKTYDVFGEKERSIDIAEETYPSEEKRQEMEDHAKGCEHGWFESVYGGCQLHYRKWLPSGEPKGIVIFNHGIAAHSGRGITMKDGRKLGTALLADVLTKEGFALYSFDQLGHGYSEGIRWYVPDYKVNRDDCVSFCKLVATQHKEDTPLFLIGESYGGCLTLHAAQYFEDHPDEKPKGFDSVMLIAPAIIGKMPAAPVFFLLRYVFAGLAPTAVPDFMPTPISMEKVWRDDKVLEIMKERTPTKIDGAGYKYRLGTAVALLLALEDVRAEVIPKFSLPYCVIHGEKDLAVPNEGTDFLLEKSKTAAEDRAVHRIPEAYHDVLLDPVAEGVAGNLMEWIKARMASKK